MMEYVAPQKDMQFALKYLANMASISELPGFEEISIELTDAVMEEAAKYAAEVLSPLNAVGDREGARLDMNGDVQTATGWLAAYRQFCETGWHGLAAPKTLGGQGLPQVVSAVVDEMWNGANASFALAPMLTRGAIAALGIAGSEALKARYLGKLVSGEWSGTMNLTEPQAGSDLAAIRTRATPQGDGSYRVQGQKIFITYGEHGMTENIVHLVLARTPDAPEGVKGISLFVVPKFLSDGEPPIEWRRNDVRCVSLEHKLGIHGSPTAVMSFGDQGGAVGYLVGEENKGLGYMFIMMNEARFGIGLQGIGIAERAYQRAWTYAQERIQGTEAGRQVTDRVALIRHPDVRRMLLSMSCRIEAMRALALVTAAAMDVAHAHPQLSVRQENQAWVDLMIPVVKGWSTENCVDIASLGVQVHGGMGFIEETGAAQHLRDARITTIYEGTTGIQAADLVGRKIVRDQGEAIGRVIARMREAVCLLSAQDDPQLVDMGKKLAQAVEALGSAVGFLLGHHKQSPQVTLFASVPFLELFGIVAGGWQMGRAALAASKLLRLGEDDPVFLKAKILSARFYTDHVLVRAASLASIVTDPAVAVSAMSDDPLN